MKKTTLGHNSNLFAQHSLLTSMLSLGIMSCVNETNPTKPTGDFGLHIGNREENNTKKPLNDKDKDRDKDRDKKNDSGKKGKDQVNEDKNKDQGQRNSEKPDGNDDADKNKDGDQGKKAGDDNKAKQNEDNKEEKSKANKGVTKLSLIEELGNPLTTEQMEEFKKQFDEVKVICQDYPKGNKGKLLEEGSTLCKLFEGGACEKEVQQKWIYLADVCRCRKYIREIAANERGLKQLLEAMDVFMESYKTTWGELKQDTEVIWLAFYNLLQEYIGKQATWIEEDRVFFGQYFQCLEENRNNSLLSGLFANEQIARYVAVYDEAKVTENLQAVVDEAKKILNK